MVFKYRNNLGEHYTVTLFTLDFLYDDQQFHCLVRAKANHEGIFYSLTLLNLEMEEVFAEPYILTEKDRVLHIEAPSEQTEYTGVKFASMVALHNHLAKHQTLNPFKRQYIA